MRRKPSAPSLISDSGPEDFLDFHHHDFDDDAQSSIFMADATESGNTSDREKDDSTTSPNEYALGVDEGEVTEGTSLLAPPTARRATYGGVTILKHTKEEEQEVWKEEGFWNGGGHSVPNVIYASPARPHLPSPSASNPRLSGLSHLGTEGRLMIVTTPGLYLPYNWRTPSMVPYDVQAHPFNRAPSASPQVTAPTRARYMVPRSDTEVTGGSSRSSVWSVELEQGSCGCISACVPQKRKAKNRIWQYCFGRAERSDTLSDG